MASRARTEPQFDRNTSDTRLLRAVAGGSRGALVALYDRYAPHVLALARHILGAGHEADELVAEVYIDLWQQGRLLLRRKTRPRAWILLRTRQLALLSVEQAPELQELGTTASFLPPRWRPQPTTAPPYPDSTRFGGLRAELCLALGFLPSRSRRALELSFFAGMPLTQVALCTGQPEAGAASRLARARAQVSRHLQEAGTR